MKDLTGKIVRFVEERDWKQFHNPKDTAISLVLEATEYLEHFQWKNPEEIKKHIENKKDEIGEELADILYWVILNAHYLDIDLEKALEEKLEKNAQKYPVDKAKGKHTKYTEL
jgi:dCTP diphosphatase